MPKNISYSELVNEVEANKLNTRYDVVSYCIGRYGIIDKKIFELINKLYADGFVK